MRMCRKIILTCIIAVISSYNSDAQLQITNISNAQALVQMLLGQGISVSNVTLTGHPAMTGFFHNISGTNIGIDSGIVLTNGCAKTNAPPPKIGMDGNGVTAAININAYNKWGFPGDPDLSAIVNDVTFDACVLQFDFIPLGDSIKFRYVFSSEEYTDFACTQFNDAFAFFISGPGIVGLKNIALIPGTNLPVTINNINIAGCAPYPQYYVDNSLNTKFTHDGHTVVFTALAAVQPCQTYHLKLAIADVSDDDLDSGVFLEAKSLSSNVISINNNTQVDQNNNSYLVEGCSTGSFKIKRPQADPSPLSVQLSYTGTATNGVDMQLLPSIVTIPANQTEVTVNVIPIVDNIPEGIETINIYALAGCASGTPTDSTVIQIRDYDTLGITPDTAAICRNTSIQLIATTGYSFYQWDPNPTLSNLAIRNPIASPVNNATTYYCTATEGTCHGRDSSFIAIKQLSFVSKIEINCKNDATGEIRVAGGSAWTRPAFYSINNSAYQVDSTFINLPVGVYTIKIKDATGCIDSLVIPITQLFPDFLITGTPVTPSTCTGNPDGTLTVNVSGGMSPYLFSTDGINFQNSNLFNLVQGNYIVTVKDNNNCPASQNIFIPLFNHLTLDAGPDTTNCEGRTTQLNAISNGDSFSWIPAATLNNSTIPDPIASPVITTQYIVTTFSGICSKSDSITVLVHPSPIANAGPDQSICFGQNTQLNGSGGQTYTWQPTTYLDNYHLASPTLTQLPASRTYFLSVVNNFGCRSLQTDAVTITVTRPAVVNVGRDTTLAIGQPLPLFATDVNNIGFMQYEWNPHDYLNDPFIVNPIATPDRDMNYTVTARNALGCTATDYLRVKVYRGPDIYVPNAFTPDGDGLNDILKAIPVGIGDFHYFRIYDRWGKGVFSTVNPTIGWDGKLAGVLQHTGTYVWMAEGIDYKGNLVQRKGTVTIIR